MNKPYIVSQTYTRAFDPFDEEHKTGLLLTEYGSLQEAQAHRDTIKEDRYAAILDLTKPAHKEKLEEMMKTGSPYRLFWAVIKSMHELEARLNDQYKERMRRYIQTHTNWRIGRATTVKPLVQVHFGELYILLKYGSEERRIKFEEIEKR